MIDQAYLPIADWIVTGTLTEDAADLAELHSRLSEVIDALKSL